MLHQFLDIVLHLDVHLNEWITQFGSAVYWIVFLIVFAETGLVVTPFLPGDSLLFALGALCDGCISADSHSSSRISRGRFPGR